MDYIDYGLSVLKAESLTPWPDDEPFDLALALERLAEENQLAGFEVSKRFYEFGSPEGLAAADEYLRGKDS